MFSNTNFSKRVKKSLGTLFQKKKSIFWVITMPIIFVIVFALNSCNSTAFDKTENQISATPSYALPAIGQIPSATSTSTVVADPALIARNLFKPVQTLTPTQDLWLEPYYWRDWAVDPELTQRAQEIILNAINNPNLDLHVFSKVGDCQMTSSTFLGGFANGKYAIPDGYSETVRWFSDSMAGESVTAANGLGINSVFSPLFGLAAGHTQCGRNETPLDCELRTKRPAFVLIGMGTNWKPSGELSFEKYLRTVVDRVLATGALPILATKADNIEGDWKLNQAIAQVAYEYDLPLVNVWRSVQDLPNHGLESPKNIYLTGDGWMRRNYAWFTMLGEIHALIAEQ